VYAFRDGVQDAGSLWSPFDAPRPMEFPSLVMDVGLAMPDRSLADCSIIVEGEAAFRRYWLLQIVRKRQRTDRTHWPCCSPDQPDQLVSNLAMARGGQVNAINLDHSRSPGGVDYPISFDGPDPAPMKFSDNLHDIGPPGFRAESATMLATLEIVPAKIQNDKRGSVWHRTVETCEHSAGRVSADPGIGDMRMAASGAYDFASSPSRRQFF
jgi:hypothetical protein